MRVGITLSDKCLTLVPGRIECHEKWQFLMVTRPLQKQQTQERGQGGPWERAWKKGCQGPPYRGEVTAFWKVASHALDMVLSELTNLRFISIRSQG